ncbi:MAG: hypothetical protein WC449_04960 [Candidatus Paceibacterota bacterium]
MKVIRVIYEHWRYPEQNNKRNTDNLYTSDRLYRYKRNFKTFVPSGRGGMTICRLVLEDGREFVGVAHCNTIDNFNYRLGRKIAFGRVWKELLKERQLELKQQFDELPF